MRYGPRSRGVFVALAAVLASACGGRARGCRSPDATPIGSYRLHGRFDGKRFSWSGSTIEARFTGSSLAMRLRVAPLDQTPDPAARSVPYTVRLDDRAPVTLEVSPERERYELATGLDPARIHEVSIVRETEAFAGVHELLGLDLGPGGAFQPDKPRSLRIEIIGDSITCGYGVTGDGPGCPFTYATERASEAYGARLGRMLDADVTTVCWSGRGVLRNYDGSTAGTMPELFELAVPTAPTTLWSFATAPAPEVVIVALGTNDFQGGEGRPLDLVAFEDAYTKFARRLRAVYPVTLLLLTTSPMLKHEPMPAGPGPVDDLLRARLEHVVARRTSEGDRTIELVSLPNDAPHWGCGGHPDGAMNARIADRLAALIRSRLRP